ncbi:hypothetical protein C7M79_13790 [Clostridium botulinum]|uniref:hypothetical protein n=1 Tax=Clostridium botulinum TaxID=1491 RepID=UPI000D222D71|nr:hypothetical protein C7M79_13790 [Clostridium botulinum]
MDNFEYANDELGELINDGVFGENVKQLTDQFGRISNSDYYCKSLDLWLQNPSQFGKENVKIFINIFSKIIIESFEVDNQKTSYEIISFLQGDDANNRTETLSSYTQYILYNETFIEELEKKSAEEKSIKNTKQISNALINAYNKGVEYISKIYSLVNILFCITDKRKIDINNINRKTLYEKCKDIKSRKVAEYNILVDSIDRNIRNADSHSTIYFNVDKGEYVYKLLRKGKWKYINVTASDMIINIYPKIGWIIQGFIYTISLFIIASEDKNKYIEYSNKIFN